jgi:uncharacterized protein
MKKYCLVFVATIGIIVTSFSQVDTIRFYKKSEVMIPMRDGVKLNTIIFSPVEATLATPILLQRTPYGADPGFANDSAFNVTMFPNNVGIMLKEGYYYVIQDIRGKYKSEGSMEIHQPIIHVTNKNAIDESTDTYDTVDWLIKNLKNNNNKVGIFGVSYPGWLALAGAVNPHPALKASSEQACMADLFLGDDFHHNGAFRLSYGMEYTYEVEHDKTTDSDFPFPQYDVFDWYLKLGSLKNVNENYFKGKIPTWNNFVKHPNYDDFWEKNSTLSYVSKAEIPQLHVGGYYDQEDLNGPQLMYSHMEKNDKANNNHIVLGPWNHGQWTRNRADSLGKIAFESNTAIYFQALQKKWFDYYLKNIGDGKFEEAYCFQTGTNQWKTYNTWPPTNSVIKKLYATAYNTCSFNKPTTANSFTSYISDPAKPVPYRSLPIEPTYANGSRWRSWHVEDQRHIASRPDVLNFTMDALQSDLTLTGKVTAHLFASTSGTDADWVVKLIDVYPDVIGNNLPMSGFQLPVAMEVFRGRFRKSFTNPTPLVANKPEEFVIDLHDINHTFKRGHRMMIQIQSTWFPVIDRNPQKYIPNIFEAKETDFIKATQRIYHNSKYATYIGLPVVE